MLTQQRVLFIGKQWECSNIHLFYALPEIAFFDVLISATSRKQYVSTNNFLGNMLLIIGTIIDSIPVAVHLIDGIRHWVICQCSLVVVHVVVVCHTVFRIVKICKCNILAYLILY